MDREFRRSLEAFLRPYYQGIDGSDTRFEEVDRISRIARRLYSAPSCEAERSFELLLLFHRLGLWLEKVGNLSRAMLAVGGLTETELRQTAASIRRLHAPITPAERAAAAAVMIDSAGVRGLTEQFAGARREGSSLMDVLRAALSDGSMPEWLPPGAEEWIQTRRAARREVCRRLLEELSLDDQPRSRV